MCGSCIFLNISSLICVIIFQTIPVEEMIKGDFKSNFSFLKWFKVFYSANLKNQDYDPLNAREGQDICPNKPSPTSPKASKSDS